MTIEPMYLASLADGSLEKKIIQARKRLRACALCPRKCQVNRLAGETGVCKTGERAWISSFNPHFGEEAPLVGRHGSGTIFFTHCNLLCNFCQNYDISHEGHGQKVTDEELASVMLSLQKQGCHNINFVTPSHVVPQILSAVAMAARNGLTIPLVYNSGGYDSVSTLKLLEGVIDIYMPDFKYWDAALSVKTCDAEDYPEVAQRALLEMHRQVGDLTMDPDGVALRGLLIRHLVLPKGMAGTRHVMRFIAKRLSPNTYVNIMTQYRPCGKAGEIPELAVRPSQDDFESAVRAAEKEGIQRLDKPRRVFVLW